MEFDTQWDIFCGVLLLIAGASAVMRSVCLSAMRRVPGQSIGELQAAELAYLCRPGDSSHCLIVVLVDLVQKALKPLPPEPENQLSVVNYEKEIWQYVQDYVKGWSKQKAQELVPELATRNPIRIVVGFWRLRSWIAGTFKNFLDSFIKDPLHIRKYFSPAGLMKAFVSIAGSGLKEQLEQSVRETLLERNLLVAQELRGKFSAYFIVIGILNLIFTAILLVRFTGINHWQSILALTLCAAFNGALLRVLSVLPLFVPFYEELSTVLDSVKRHGMRIRTLRTVLKFLRASYWTLVGIISSGIFVLQALAFAYLLGLHSSQWWINLLGVISLTLNFFMIAELFSLSYKVGLSEQLSSNGLSLFRRYHKQLRKVSLLEAFAKTLSEPEYNKELSEIVALYGIETLFLLA